MKKKKHTLSGTSVGTAIQYSRKDKIFFLLLEASSHLGRLAAKRKKKFFISIKAMGGGGGGHW